MQNMDNLEIIATLLNPGFPIGRHEWSRYSSESSDTDYLNLNLHKNVEQPGTFCCDNGKCIESHHVCDNVPNCEGKRCLKKL